MANEHLEIPGKVEVGDTLHPAGKGFLLGGFRVVEIKAGEREGEFVFKTVYEGK